MIIFEFVRVFEKSISVPFPGYTPSIFVDIGLKVILLFALLEYLRISAEIGSILSIDSSENPDVILDILTTILLLPPGEM